MLLYSTSTPRSPRPGPSPRPYHSYLSIPVSTVFLDFHSGCRVTCALLEPLSISVQRVFLCQEHRVKEENRADKRLFLFHTRVIWREQKQARTPLLVLYFKSGTPNQNFRKETLAFRLNQEFCLLGLPKTQARGCGEECWLARWQKIGKEESLVLNVLPGGVSCL